MVTKTHNISRGEAHKAAETLRDPKASRKAKSEAGSELSHARVEKGGKGSC